MRAIQTATLIVGGIGLLGTLSPAAALTTDFVVRDLPNPAPTVRPVRQDCRSVRVLVGCYYREDYCVYQDRIVCTPMLDVPPTDTRAPGARKGLLQTPPKPTK